MALEEIKQELMEEEEMQPSTSGGGKIEGEVEGFNFNSNEEFETASLKSIVKPQIY